MKAFLLAGGYGTRLRPLTNSVPKCLVEIAGKPLLQYWLENLSQIGVRQFLINTHYLSEQVVDFIANSKFCSAVELVYEPELLGTLGSLRANRAFFGAEDFLLAHADNFCQFDWRRFLNCHTSRPEECLLTLALFETDTPHSCGMVRLDEHHVVETYVEKPQQWQGKLANGAVLLCDNRIWQVIDNTSLLKNDLCKDVLPKLTGAMLGHQVDGLLKDIGNIEALNDVRRLVAEVQVQTP